MKKTIIALFLAIVIIVPGWSVYARNNQENESEKNKMRVQLEAKDIKIHKKKVISDLEKKNLDEMIKGKPTAPPGLDKDKNDVSVASETATGILGTLVSGEKYAIVVGICDYPGEANDICISDGDAQNMNNALVTMYDYNPENIFLLRDMEATYDSILNAVDEIRSRVSNDDEVVFFFSGHGTTANVSDGDKEKIDEGLVVHNGTNLQYIWDGQLKSWFSDFATNRIAFIFDICKAGGMNDVAENGRVVVMSSQEKENSFVYSAGVNGEGLFSRFFVNQGMLQGMADGFNELKIADEKVVLEESFVYAKEFVSWYADTKLWHSQIPSMSDLFVNDLFL